MLRLNPHDLSVVTFIYFICPRRLNGACDEVSEFNRCYV